MHDYTDAIEAARGDADALYRIATELSGVVRFLQGNNPAPRRKAPRPSDDSVDGGGSGGVSRATWLTPIMEVWDKERGGVFPASALKPFSQLRKKGHTEHEIAKRLGFYLRSQERKGEAKFDNVVKFAQQFKLFDPDEIVDDE